MLEMFNIVYFIWLAAAVLLFLLVYFGLKNRSYKFKYWFLFSLTVLAWGFHFARIWLDPDIRTFEWFMKDLCGFSTLVYPFFFLSKHDRARDYMYFVGGVFASHSLFFPNNIFGDEIFIYNTIRFFFAHFILVSVPLLLVFWKMHTPSYKNIPMMFIYMMVGAMYNFSLSTFFYEMGWTYSKINFMGLWGNTDTVFRVFEKFSPFLRYDVIENGLTVSKPVPFFYMIPGLIAMYGPLWILMSLPFVKRIRTNENK